MPDRYSYPNSLVLINKLGITDYDRWKAVETAAIHQRMVELTEHPIPGRYDLPHLQAIHQHLTADLYVWGGDIRDTDTHPGGTGIAHCRPPFIVPEAEGSDVGCVDSGFSSRRECDAAYINNFKLHWRQSAQSTLATFTVILPLDPGNDR